jgi:hypothetical protein
MTRDQAAEALIEILGREGYETGVSIVLASLQKPPRISQMLRGAEYHQVSQWYGALPEDAQEYVRFLVREAAAGSLWGLFVALDGASAEPHLVEKPYLFSVVLHRFEDQEAIRRGDPPTESITICPPAPVREELPWSAEYGEDLHGIFSGWLDDHAASGADPPG